ncbi:hypothetical protein BH11BAC3_BH11BAC3_00410 [soil metagenome]
MKKSLKIIILILIVAAIGGYIYWQYNKRNLVKDKIENTISDKTDSLYFIKYDSSAIDEINGNVSFYNVVLQSDSAQKKLLNRTDSLPNALYNIRVAEVTAKGIDVSGLLQKQNVAANKILLIKPVIQIINTGTEQPKPFTKNDTLELYKKILGKFNSIQADTIQVINGTVLLTNKIGEPQTTLENINVTLNNFLIDESKNYESIISYFIKDVRATVENIQLPSSANNTRINIEKLDYNAVKRSLDIAAVRQYKLKDMNPIINLENVHISELNTDAFIIQQRLKAGSVSCAGGLITIYKNKQSDGGKKGNKEINLSSDLIDQAQVGTINLGHTKVIIINKDDPSAKPFVLNNVKFSMFSPIKINEGATLNNLINNAQWELSADGFSFDTKSGTYNIAIGDFSINNVSATAKIKQFLLKPLLSEEQFGKHNKVAMDQYNLKVDNIVLSGLNIKKLMANEGLELATASLEPTIKIFNDKTLPDDNLSRLGKYPQQSLLKLDMPIYIKTLKIKNGLVSYRERGEKSALVGNVFFSGINATVSNITNIPALIKSNPALTLDATAKFLDKGSLSTHWSLALNTNAGIFHIDGQLDKMSALSLNPVTEPLALASIKQGTIDKVKFKIDGDNYKASANVLFLYHDLKLDVLKKEEDKKELKKKGLVSFLANALVKNKNSNTDNSENITYERVMTRSFFNLVWKTIFTGAKKTAL